MMKNCAYLIAAIALILPLSACNTTAQGAKEPVKTTQIMQTNPAQLKTNAQRSFRKGDYKSAAGTFYAVLQKNPADEEARFGLAESYLKLNENGKAVDYYQDLLAAPGYKWRALQGIGLAELQRNNIDVAEEALNNAVAGDQTLWRAWNGLARLYDQKKNWDLAFNAYEKALAHTDRPEIIYNNLGVSYMAREDFDNAADAFKKALDHKPGLEIARTNYRLALSMQNRYDEATLVNNVHDEAKALNNAGYTAMVRGDYAEAEKLFLKSLETNPSFYKPAYDNLQVLYHLRKR